MKATPLPVIFCITKPSPPKKPLPIFFCRCTLSSTPSVQARKDFFWQMMGVEGVIS